mmetsp:Transcript_6725/g.20940  ORF Transcript_6725/g.20940 Transcript_6725/m.20940 type:complete len:342 (-) Transcript_6725:274-1299(-)
MSKRACSSFEFVSSVKEESNATHSSSESMGISPTMDEENGLCRSSTFSMKRSNLLKRINAMTAYTIPLKPNTKNAPFQPITGTKNPPNNIPNPEPTLNMLNKVVKVSPLSASRKYADVPQNPAAAGNATPDANPNNNLLMSNIANGVKIVSNPKSKPPPRFNHNNVGNTATANDQKNSAKNNKLEGLMLPLFLLVASCPPITFVLMYPIKKTFCIHPICAMDKPNSLAMGNAVSVKIVRSAVLKSNTIPSVITACVLCLNNANAIGLVKPTKFSSYDIPDSHSIPMIVSFFATFLSKSSSSSSDDFASKEFTAEFNDAEDLLPPPNVKKRIVLVCFLCVSS